MVILVMKIKHLVILVTILLFLGVGYWVSRTIPNQADNKNSNTSVEPASNNDEDNYILDKYPIKEVPLYKVNKVSATKIFVNTDPKNKSPFGGSNFAYYNVVFYTEAGGEEFLNYYKNLFDTELKEEYPSPDMVKGRIGEYGVTAAHYGEDSAGYVQVYLKDINSQEINGYFLDYPDIIGANQYLTEHEKSFGLLNQKGGEAEYTKYFTVSDSGDEDKDGKDDVDEMAVLEEQFGQKFGGKPEYQFNEASRTMKWKDDDYGATLVISPDHGRVYLMLRKEMER